MEFEHYFQFQLYKKVQMISSFIYFTLSYSFCPAYVLRLLFLLLYFLSRMYLNIISSKSAHPRENISHEFLHEYPKMKYSIQYLLSALSSVSWLFRLDNQIIFLVHINSTVNAFIMMSLMADES